MDIGVCDIPWKRRKFSWMSDQERVGRGSTDFSIGNMFDFLALYIYKSEISGKDGSSIFWERLCKMT